MTVEPARAALTGSRKAFHEDFDSLPAVGPDEEISVTIRVKRKRELPQFHGLRMTHEQHARDHGADPESLAKVRSFAAAHGLEIVAVLADRREIVARGSARAMHAAFSADLRVAEINGKKCRVRRGEICVPADLVASISSVTGLDNRPFAKPHYRVTRQVAHAAGGGAAAAPVNETAFTPVELASLYNFPVGMDGSGQTIAILELDGGFRPDELAAYFKELGVPQPTVTIVPFEGGGANNPGLNALDPFCRDAEVMLDLQVAGGLAPGAQLLVYFAKDDSDQSFLAAVSAIVHDAARKPDIISISWGGPELTATGQFRNDFDQVLQTAAHLGITVCVATGDNASPDFAAEDPGWDGGAHVDFPACDPWVLACGGTRISVAGGAIEAEDVWFEGPHAGTGGGVSRAFPLPEYQKTASIPRAANPDGPVMRGIPDVSANAAPASGFRILCDAQHFPDPDKNVPPMGGTSAVAPLWSALVARLNQALGRRCGFMNPLLYELASAPGSSIWRNPASGTNGAYFAGPGWNACTGLGSVDGTRLLNAMRARTKADSVGQ
jgi:kumamolisin